MADNRCCHLVDEKNYFNPPRNLAYYLTVMSTAINSLVSEVIDKPLVILGHLANQWDLS